LFFNPILRKEEFNIQQDYLYADDYIQDKWHFKRSSKEYFIDNLSPLLSLKLNEDMLPFQDRDRSTRAVTSAQKLIKLSSLYRRIDDARSRRVLFECCAYFIKLGEIVPVRLILSENEIILEKVLDKKAQKTFNLLNLSILNLNKVLWSLKILPLKSISKLLRMRFLHQEISLEVALKSYTRLQLVFFNETEREKLINLIDMRKYNIKMRNVSKEITRLKNSWANEEISNFEFLLKINKLASRSILDISQYPIFPWIVLTFERGNNPDQKHVFRDLQKPSGLICSHMLKLVESNKIEEYNHSYERTKIDSPKYPYHYSTYISSPTTIIEFALRLQPFGELGDECSYFKKITQSSLSYSMKSYLEKMASNIEDVRELIPELFYLPEILLTPSKINSTLQDCKFADVAFCQVDWADHNPYVFVQEHRKMLESKIVSRKLHEWINLIFGVNSRGKNAEDCKNLYNPMFIDDSECIEEAKIKCNLFLLLRWPL